MKQKRDIGKTLEGAFAIVAFVASLAMAVLLVLCCIAMVKNGVAFADEFEAVSDVTADRVEADEAVRYEQLASLGQARRDVEDAQQAQDENVPQEPQDAAWYEEWVEPEYEPAWEDYGDYSGSVYSSDFDFMRDGVARRDDGTPFTWYSSNVLYHYRTPEWNLDDEGFYHTDEGYYVVASSDYPEGTIVDTPWGEGMVLDDGCDPGTFDMYTAF